MGLENPLHLAIIALVLVLLFGAKHLPELGRSLGTGMRDFKSSLTGSTERMMRRRSTMRSPMSSRRRQRRRGRA